MLKLEVFEKNSPEQLSREQLDTAISALSNLSLGIFRDELVKAQLETTMEYHRTEDRSIRQDLWAEIQCLNALIASCIRVGEEYADIRGHSSSND